MESRVRWEADSGRALATLEERVQTHPGMTFVADSRLFPRTLWRPALFIFAIAQVLLTFAPVFEGRRGPGASAHVEEAGTSLHHGHDESGCVACIARGMLSEPNATGPSSPLYASARLSGFAPVESPAIPGRSDATRSRA